MRGKRDAIAVRIFTMNKIMDAYNHTTPSGQCRSTVVGAFIVGSLGTLAAASRGGTEQNESIEKRCE